MLVIEGEVVLVVMLDADEHAFQSAAPKQHLTCVNRSSYVFIIILHGIMVRSVRLTS